ncbi:MAG: hypothetical protein JWM23_535 [Microbacteriaceae bacterium]|nr:hypothetical protein [Microbacteriaceae bacterium]
MGINPGNLAYGMPPAADDQVRKQRDLERQARENASARGLAASQIGSGGLLVTDGGSITIEGTGSLNVGAGALNSAGAISAGTTIAAGTDITAGGKVTATGEVKGGTVTSTGDVAAAGIVSAASVSATGQVSGDTALFPGGVNSVDVYNRLLTYGGGYKNQYVHVDGSMGYVPSSRRFKQDITTAALNPAVLSYLRVVTYRYIAAVQNPEYEAATEVGLIAEEVHDLGLTWLVDYDDEGLPMGVKYDRLALVFIPWMQSVEERLAAAGL